MVQFGYVHILSLLYKMLTNRIRVLKSTVGYTPDRLT